MKEDLEKKQERSEELVEILEKIVRPYCYDLDKYMGIIDDTLANNKVTDIPTKEVEEWIMNITSILYYTTSGLEEVGLKQDMFTAIRQEVYAKAHNDSTGTVAERQNTALLAVQEEDLVMQIYSRAYKQLKAKIDAGYEMQSAMKKVLSARITDSEISASRYNNGKGEYT